MGLSEIKKELKKLDKDKLIELIAELYKKNKSVKEFFDFYVDPDERQLFQKYRDKIFYAFYPERGYNFKFKDAKQALIDFKNLGTSPDSLVELMLFYVQTGVDFTNDFGDIDEAFYYNIERVYVQALTLAQKEYLLEKYNDRAKKVVIETRDIGWGFNDSLADTYFNFYPEGFKDDLEESKNNSEKSKGRIINLGRQKLK